MGEPSLRDGVGRSDIASALQATNLSVVRVVIDTNVLVSSLRSRRGASFRLVQLLGTGRFLPVISPPLCLEYEDVFRRREMLPGFSDQDIGDFLDYMLS